MVDGMSIRFRPTNLLNLKFWAYCSHKNKLKYHNIFTSELNDQRIGHLIAGRCQILFELFYYRSLYLAHFFTSGFRTSLLVNLHSECLLHADFWFWFLESARTSLSCFFSRKVFCGCEYFESYNLYEKFASLCMHFYGILWDLTYLFTILFFAASFVFLGALFFENLIEIKKPLKKNTATDFNQSLY